MRDLIEIPFYKSPVATLMPSICKLFLKKIVSDSENPSQSTSAYFKDECTWGFELDFKCIMAQKNISMALGGLIFLEAFWWIFRICTHQR